MPDMPVACALTASELRDRERWLVETLGTETERVERLPDGYALQLRGTHETLINVAELIGLERQCCPFLTFTMTVEPAAGPIHLLLTGPEGTAEFLSTTLIAAFGRPASA
jgi:hypothetical protein